MKAFLRFKFGAPAFMIMGLSIIAAGQVNREPDSARQAELQQILAQNCTVCHGPKLKGKVGPALTAKALAAKNEQILITTILEGRPGTTMPAWDFMLQESDARWLVMYLRNKDK